MSGQWRIYDVSWRKLTCIWPWITHHHKHVTWNGGKTNQIVTCKWRTSAYIRSIVQVWCFVTTSYHPAKKSSHELSNETSSHDKFFIHGIRKTGGGSFSSGAHCIINARHKDPETNASKAWQEVATIVSFCDWMRSTDLVYKTLSRRRHRRSRFYKRSQRKPFLASKEVLRTPLKKEYPWWWSWKRLLSTTSFKI